MGFFAVFLIGLLLTSPILVIAALKVASGSKEEGMGGMILCVLIALGGGVLTLF